MLGVETIANTFRFLGDAFHVSSKVVLAHKIEKTKSCSGLSFKTQFLYFLVFICRYFDIFEFKYRRFMNLYNLILKICFVAFQAVILYLVRIKYYASYDSKSDTFKIRLLVIPSAVVSLLLKSKSEGVYEWVSEYLYCFSLVLESIAILPQLVQLQEEGESESMTSVFILLLGLYRAMYTIYFLLKWAAGLRVSPVLMACGMIQVLVYLDFFFVYYKHVFKKTKKTLPTMNK
ncbi:ER lumen protein-retaining receptor 1 [Nosema granulosis]|uniref:ER lumen protein-retaining receptor 1 n=1 Tax=Nosema granulosis TaxID=83296 RepID=A0A9P6GVN1_9MICR|nr:ER lumen protein-retaining receptor 1 [Nosema granulosis]